MSTPVIARIHAQANAPTEPRPFSKEEETLLWNLLIEHGDLVLLTAFAIGMECGLRVGEVCNIRLSDIDFQRERIFVRLPTKI
jgi:integrase